MRLSLFIIFTSIFSFISLGNAFNQIDLKKIEQCLSEGDSLVCQTEIDYQIKQASGLADKAYLDFILNVSTLLMKSGISDTAIKKLQFMISESDRLGLVDYQIRGNIRLGVYYRNLNEWSKSESCHRLAIDLSKESYEDLLPRSYAVFADYYKIRGMYPEAQEMALKALSIANKNGNDVGKYYAYSSLGGIYNMNRMFEKAYGYNQEANKYSVYLDDDSLAYVTTLASSAAVLMGLKRFEEAQEILHSIKPVLERRSLYRRLAMCNTHIATTYVRDGKYSIAKSYYDRGLEYAVKANDDVIILYVHRMLSSYHHEQLAYDKALDEAYKALEISDEIGVNQNTLQILETLSSIYKDRGDMKMAFKFNEQSHSLKDSLIGVKTRAQLLAKEKQMEDEIKQQEIASLKSEAKIKRTRNTFGFIGLGLLGLLGWLMIRKQRQKIESNKLLAVQQEELHQEQLAKEKLEKQNISLELEQNRRELTGKALHIAEKNELLGQLESELKSINSSDVKAIEKILRNIKMSSVQENDWDQFVSVFESVHPNFIAGIKVKYDGLTPSDIRLATLIKMNFNTKQIAAILHISELGVKKARYRLRKKLALNEADSLEDYIAGIS